MIFDTGVVLVILYITLLLCVNKLIHFVLIFASVHLILILIVFALPSLTIIKLVNFNLVLSLSFQPTLASTSQYTIMPIIPQVP